MTLPAGEGSLLPIQEMYGAVYIYKFMRKFLSHVVMAVMVLSVICPPLWAVNGEPLKRAIGTKSLSQTTAKVDLKAKAKSGKAFVMPKKKAAAKATASQKMFKKSGFRGAKALLAPQSAIRKAPLLAGGSSTPLLGSVTYSDGQSYLSGMFSIPTDGTTAMTELSDDIEATSGVLVDGVYYATSYFEIFGYMFVTHTAYDAETWEKIGEASGDVGGIALDMAYDAVTEKVYGCFYNDDANGYVFGTLDLTTFERTAICPLTSAYFGIAAAADGTLYAIDKAGNLYTVNKETGSATLVGSTGLATQYITSAAIDQKTGRMYYAICTDEVSEMYEVNKVTAEATLIASYDNEAEFLGLCVPVPAAEDKAPAAAENLKAGFADGSLAGTLTFDIPAKTFDGAAATGLVKYTVNINGVDAVLDSAEVGTAVSVPVTVSAPGNYKFIVTLSNPAGKSPKTSVELWVGNDTPKAVENAVLAYADGKMNLTWDAVTESVNGGYFDAEAVTYTVTRYPDAIVVAKDIKETSFSEAVSEPEEGLVSYYYGVSAKSDTVMTKETESNHISLGSVVPPYLNDFESPLALDGYTAINLNNDGKNWKLSGGMATMSYNSDLDMDSWLITPALKLEAGKQYEVSFVAASGSSFYMERIEAFFGTAPTVEAMTGVLVEKTDIKDKEGITLKAKFVAETDGLYYIGLHGCSDKDMLSLYVDDLSVSAGVSTNAPAAVSDLKVTPDFNGGLSAEVSFKTPTTALNDAAVITELTKVEVSRDGEVVKTFDAPAVGTVLSFTDTPETEGKHVYTVVAYNSYGAGEAAEAGTYIGINIPAAPASATVVETENEGEVTISWEAPATDVDGNPINPALVKYDIAAVIDGEVAIIAKDLDVLSYTYQAVPAGGEQDFKYYGVFAKTAAGSSDVAVTDMIPVGPAYRMPVSESFAGGTIVNDYIWGIESSEGSDVDWTLLTDESGVSAQDGDNGFLASVGQYRNESAWFFSGKIKVDVENPVLIFYYYAWEEGKNTIDLQINSGNGLETVKSFVAGADEDGWIKAEVSLAEYKGKSIQFAFFTTILSQKYTLIDNVSVTNKLDNNLTAAAIKAPARMTPNVTDSVFVTVANSGAKAAEGYTVELYRNGVLAQSIAGAALAAGESARFGFAETAAVTSGEKLEYYAVVSYEADEDKSDNTTDKVTSKVVLPNYPTVTDLSAANTDAGVALTWSEPDMTAEQAVTVTDDFEGYESFSTTAGDWTFVDVDQAEIGGFEGIEITNIPSRSLQSFWVHDVSDAETYNQTFAACSGTKYLASMFRYDGGTVDDWAISPVLSGNAQTISFYARSYSSNYPETIEILYSTKGKDVEDFVSIATYEGIASDWKEYTAELPAGAKYFAIRSKATDSFMLMIDDVTYETVGKPEELALVGYNVYRDGVKINTEPVAEPAFTDADITSGEHSYAVTVVYDKGESKLSNVVTILVDKTAIDAIGASAVKVYGADRTLTVAGAAGKNVSVYTADGRLVYTGEGSDKTTVRVESGVYVVRVGNTVVKTSVR